MRRSRWLPIACVLAATAAVGVPVGVSAGDSSVQPMAPAHAVRPAHLSHHHGSITRRDHHKQQHQHQHRGRNESWEIFLRAATIRQIGQDLNAVPKPLRGLPLPVFVPHQAPDPPVRLHLHPAPQPPRGAPTGHPAPLHAVDGKYGDVPTIMGPTTVPRRTMVRWYLQNYADPQQTIGVGIDQLVAMYYEEGDREGVRGDIAFVQAVLETGGFTNWDSEHENNFAGIAHPDAAQYARLGWPSPRIGVRAQIQLLKKVAEGNDVALCGADVTQTSWGGAFVTTWDGLSQNWATDPSYAQDILAMFRQAEAMAGISGYAVGR